MDTPRARDAERRVAADPWDADAWMMLSSEAERVPLVAAKPVYERLVTRFPPVGRFWLCYAQHVARDTTSSPEDVIAVYQRAVTHAPTSIDLWRNYLTFISSRPQTDSSSTQEASALSIYEDAIKFAGLDLSSNLLWVQFIDFVTKQTSMSDSQRRDYLRRVYQRAVMKLHIVPLFLLFLSHRYIWSFFSPCVSCPLTPAPVFASESSGNEKKYVCLPMVVTLIAVKLFATVPHFFESHTLFLSYLSSKLSKFLSRSIPMAVVSPLFFFFFFLIFLRLIH